MPGKRAKRASELFRYMRKYPEATMGDLSDKFGLKPTTIALYASIAGVSIKGRGYVSGYTPKPRFALSDGEFDAFLKKYSLTRIDFARITNRSRSSIYTWGRTTPIPQRIIEMIKIVEKTGDINQLQPLKKYPYRTKGYNPRPFKEERAKLFYDYLCKNPVVEAASREFKCNYMVIKNGIAGLYRRGYQPIPGLKAQIHI